MRFIEKNGIEYDYHSTQIDLPAERRMLEFGNSLCKIRINEIMFSHKDGYKVPIYLY